MKKFAIAAVSLLALAAAGSVSAAEGSSCHFHGNTPASEKVVVDCASQRKAALVSSGKLEKSWEAAQVDKTEQIDGKKGKEWKATFTNPAATDKTKQNLYVFFSHPGNFIAANFTGQ